MNARMFAYTALCQICIHKTYSNLYLRKELDKAEQKDKGLITTIVYGTLQNYRLCRYQWEDLVQKLPKAETAVLLDMSAYQLFYMDKLPAYAIINEAVEIAKKHGGKKQGALVNAVLHKIMQRGQRELPKDTLQKLAIKTSHPDWLINMWKAQYGEETCRAICESNMETRKQCARVNLMRMSREEFLAQDNSFTAGQLASSVYYQGTSLAHTSWYEDGMLSIQDEASQLVAYCVDPQPKERILDVCAAPGTKSTHMAELMQDEGEIICGDIHEHRVELIQQGADRLQLYSIHPVVMDATKLQGLQEASFDRVLCDVPCSGYGVLARKSDIKYHMQSEDMDTLIPLQAAILEKASTMVKQGGILVYSTCTLNKKENEKQVETFLKKHEEFTLVSQRTIFPFEFGSDGFYIAKMEKKA